MRVELISFQDKAVKSLRFRLAEALGSYQRTNVNQVVSLQAPTGAGKTIMMASLIESIYTGMTLNNGNVFTEQQNAIFVWLSDSPELNEQSKQKIETLSNKLRFGQCITIKDESFDQEQLDDGYVYFLNTQKISKSANLTQHSDRRQYTIWETLNNTINNKNDRLYFIIDEAHRGAKTKSESGKDTTIMQRFIKGYEFFENNRKFKMKPMPVVIGMSATASRFNTLIGDTSATLQKYVVTADEVRSSGLLKDRIVITYPDDATRNNEMVLLEAAIDEWLKKRTRWSQYTKEQHAANVDPIFIIQVCAGDNDNISSTNIHDIIRKIEEKTNTLLKSEEVVHCFGSQATIDIDGLKIEHVNASQIAKNHKIKIVFFKEALSTGWDCPRAETMMSYRTAQDPTYIAQLLGRMVRTPLQCRVERDDFLNDVKLYLPYFNRENVENVVDELQSTEGGEIPTEINGESLEEPTYITWTVVPVRHRHEYVDPNQLTLFGDSESDNNSNSGKIDDPSQAFNNAPEYHEPQTIITNASQTNNQNNNDLSSQQDQQVENVQLCFEAEINREEIIKFINGKAYKTYLVRQDRINDYLKSLLDLSTLLTQNMIYSDARDEVVNDILDLIKNYINNLKLTGKYAELAKKILEFKLSVQVFDSLGNEITVANNNLFLSSETDIDRQLRNADAKMGRYGIPNLYGGRYYDKDNPNDYKIDCILFAASEECRNKLGDYAKQKLYNYVSRYRLDIVNRSDACQRRYHDILADSDIVSEQIFKLPENMIVRKDDGGNEYHNHLYVSSETGSAIIKLNSWEKSLIENETCKNDFVCWLRNQPRASWAMCIPYEINNETKPFYPDFLIVRRNGFDGDYLIDIIEPHGEQFTDNLAKAKGLVKYAKNENRIGRIQLVRKETSIEHENLFRRLDMTDIRIQEKIMTANNNDELNNIFINYGIID